MVKTIQALSEYHALIEAERLVLALISDQSCNVCLAIYPEIEALAEAYAELTVVSLDTALIPEIAGDQMVFVYPTLIVYAEGRETMRFERVFSMLDVEAHVERMRSFLID